MGNKAEQERLLEPYRVLDLSEQGYMLCAKILGDLGADVIKIEPPGGSPSRSIGPFYKDIPEPEKSLFWFSFCNNKRSITLNLETSDGRELFRQLVKTADFLIESFSPGFMDGLGIGYSDLTESNPGIIWVSMTPHGQTGPKAWYKGCDLTTVAASGYMYVCGEPDRPPVWISCPQTFINAAIDGFASAMFANWYRAMTGEGQHIDVSAQECSIRLMQDILPFWDTERRIVKRTGPSVPTGSGVRRRLHWRCKDGYICVFYTGGSGETFIRQDKETTKWMKENGMCPEWLEKFDWVNDYQATKMTQELVERVENAIGEFFLSMSKEEIFNEAVKRRIPLAPVYTTEDVCHEIQLEARGFWQKVEHEELGETLTYCGPFVQISPMPARIWRRPPLIGEHNLEVYEQELGINRSQLNLLKESKVI